jgi:nucleoside-diphosphate-sugar epimerase
LAALTGAAGFLGSSTARVLREAGWRVLGIDRRDAPDPHGYDEYVRADVGDVEALAATASRLRPDLWIHLAGPADVQGSFAAPARELHAHTAPTAALLEAVARAGPAAKVVVASSAAVYGEPDALPVREDAAGALPISPYGYHKRAVESLCAEFRHLFGVRVSVARIFSTFGPGLRRLAVWEIATRALRGDASLRGDGTESRDYLYVDDVARAFLAIAASAPFEGEAVNVASGVEVPIAELAREVRRGLSLAGDAAFDGRPAPGSPRRWVADVARLRALGFAPRETLRSGLQRTLPWIRAEAARGGGG